jgi:hypothetical protein
MTVRERAPGVTATPMQRRGPSIAAYINANRRLFFAQTLGYSVSASVNYGIAGWLPTFFVRTYGWDSGQAGRVQGLLTMSIGVIGALAGGWLADGFVRRGRTDGPLLVGIVGAGGMLVAATLYPLMPTASLAVVGLAVVNLFAALPSDLAAPRCTSWRSTSFRRSSVRRRWRSLQRRCSAIRWPFVTRWPSSTPRG